jgi:hypothetical protein
MVSNTSEWFRILAPYYMQGHVANGPLSGVFRPLASPIVGGFSLRTGERQAQLTARLRLTRRCCDVLGGRPRGLPRRLNERGA